MTYEQIKAIIQMVATIAITIASIFGYQLADDQATSIGIILVACVVIAFSVWKNCNITKAAGLSQKVLDGVKSGDIDSSAVDAFLGVMDEVGIMQDGKEEKE